MFREIKKKLLILNNRRPWTPQASACIDEMDREDWVFTCMRLDDPSVRREDVSRLLRGELAAEVPVGHYLSVEGYRRVMGLARNLAAMEQDPDQLLCERLYMAFTGEAAPRYRENNPVLLALDHNPPHFHQVGQQLSILFRQLATLDFQGNPILKAAFLHNRLIEVYPFYSCSEAMARNLMYYQLLREGYPPFLLNLSEQEYYAAVRSYLKKEDMAPLYGAMERSLFNKLEVMLQLTAPG
ncbi:MAG: Fic family protein [Bacillota bacterium]|nr:Fic family protein [Bacillota bacterium]